jgi:hypothetical protein
MLTPSQLPRASALAPSVAQAEAERTALQRLAADRDAQAAALQAGSTAAAAATQAQRDELLRVLAETEAEVAALRAAAAATDARVRRLSRDCELEEGGAAGAAAAAERDAQVAALHLQIDAATAQVRDSSARTRCRDNAGELQNRHVLVTHPP